jgi:hypothetical protein
MVERDEVDDALVDLDVELVHLLLGLEHLGQPAASRSRRPFTARSIIDSAGRAHGDHRPSARSAGLRSAGWIVMI